MNMNMNREINAGLSAGELLSIVLTMMASVWFIGKLVAVMKQSVDEGVMIVPNGDTVIGGSALR